MQSDREFRAMKWSMDAMTIAKGATDYVKDLDMRLRNAAQAPGSHQGTNCTHTKTGPEMLRLLKNEQGPC